MNDLTRRANAVSDSLLALMASAGIGGLVALAIFAWGSAWPS